METSGDMIRSLRQSKGLLLRELASQLEIDSAILSKIERGERKATKEQIEQLASFFNLPDQRLKILWLSEKVLYDLLLVSILSFNAFKDHKLRDIKAIIYHLSLNG